MNRTVPALFGNSARPGRTARPGAVAEIPDTAGRAARALFGNSARPGRTARPGAVAEILDTAGRTARALEAQTALFGGTFDPIHDAHLAMARAARNRFALRRVLFVPAANPPHKSGGSMAAYEDRVRMVERACQDEPEFETSRIEQDAAPSYSILTIERLLAAGSGPLAFLIGADAFGEIRTWHRWRDVVRLVEFIVVTRPGSAYDVPADARVFELGGVDLPVSSSEVRERIARGDSNVPIPAPVFRYICEHGLYQSQLSEKNINPFPSAR